MLLRVLCLAALAVASTASSTDLEGARGSLLLWSNRGVVGDGHGSKVMYQVLEDVQDASCKAIVGLVNGQQGASELLHGKGSEDASQRSPTTIIFAGSQLGAEDLRSGSASRLSLVLDSAASSLVVPHAFGTASPASMLQTLRQSGLIVLDVGCSQRSEDLAGKVAHALASGPQAVIVCPQQQPGQEASLERELDQLLAVQEAVDASGAPHVVLYMSNKGKHHRQQRRHLAAAAKNSYPPPPPMVPGQLVGFGNYTNCGQLCQVQVRWLEGMLGLIFLALTACAGMTCLNVLNTPTRWEVLKEGATTQ